MNDRHGFSLMPAAASDYAAEVDKLFYVEGAITIFFVALIFGLIFFMMLKFKRKTHLKTPEKTPDATRTYLPLEIAWTVIPLVIALGMFVWGAKLYMLSNSNGPKDAYEVYVTGRQWMWKFQHPLGRREINEVHLPINQPVRFIMISEDVIHDMFIPVLRQKMDVLPQRYTLMWFNGKLPGEYHLFCAEYCGTKHSAMGGKAIFMDHTSFDKWLGGTQTQDSPAQQGAAVLKSLGCRSCHEAGALQSAPMLEGLFASNVRLTDGKSVVADENYIRESIINPKAKVVAGFQPIMPSYAGRITEDELIQVIAYLKSVGSSK